MSDYCTRPDGSRCTACCRFGDMPHLKPPEIPVNASGDCKFLSPTGCTVWPNCPASVNKTFDCAQIMRWPAHVTVPQRLLDAVVDRISRMRDLAS